MVFLNIVSVYIFPENKISYRHRWPAAGFVKMELRHFLFLKCSSCLLISDRCLNEYQNTGGVRWLGGLLIS
jgi:hypothetical protein